jgi:hypothetical protein
VSKKLLQFVAEMAAEETNKSAAFSQQKAGILDLTW